MYRRSWIGVWGLNAAVVDRVIIDRPESFVRMFVSPQLEVDAVFVEELLEAEFVYVGKTDT